MKKARAKTEKANTNFLIEFNRKPVAHAALLVLLGAACVMPVAAQSDAPAADASNVKTLEAVTIVSQREARVSTGATGLNLEIKETPQSISVVTAEQMQDFGVTNLNDALRLGTGIQVDEWETDRTTFSSRGFDIANTQIDGVGLPNSWGIVTGAMDSFGYEKIEFIRGANGLLTGVGNAAGTINYVRKRPTNEEQGSLGVSYGSWNTKRIEADYSTPFTEDGRWAGRVVAAREDGGSWLRGYDKERTYLSAVVDGQIGDNGTLTLGYSHQQSDSTGGMWGALTFMNTDGTQNTWSRNASTSQDWTKWDTTTQNTFVEYAHQLEAGWQLKLSYTYRKVETDTKLFYAYLDDPDSTGPTPATALDPVTHEGLYGYAWAGQDELSEHLASATVNGKFNLFGRQHEALVGVSWAKSEYEAQDHADADCSAYATYCSYIQMPGFPYSGNAIAEPDWGGLSFAGSLNQKMQRVFGTTRLSVTDRLKAIVGANYAEYQRDGIAADPATYLYTFKFKQTVSHLSPYGGLTYDFTKDVLGYVSYSDIYLPQSQIDANSRYLDPSQGTNYEVGVKADWLDKRLLTTVAVFQAKQDGLATPTGDYNTYNQAIYAPVDVKSRGVEFEATGKLNSYLDMVFGYTALELTDQGGDDTYMWVPRHTANLALKARLPSNPALSVGANGRWQSKISNEEASGFAVRQDSYAVFNTFAAYQVTPKTSVHFNINNITDEKYINTLRFAGYYGAPRNYQASLNYQF